MSFSTDLTELREFRAAAAIKSCMDDVSGGEAAATQSDQVGDLIFMLPLLLL